MERIGNKVSYIRKPMAQFSFVSLGLAAVSLILTATAVAAAYLTRGDVPLFVAAIGLSGILAGAVSVIYGILSFFEKEKNYLLAKIGLVGAGIVLLVWIIIFMTAI